MSFHNADLRVLRVLVKPRPGTSAPGSLMLCSMPGRYGLFRDFLHDLELAGIGHILCLVSDEEIAQKSHAYFKALQAESLPCEVHHLPIPDFGLPASPTAFVEALRPLWQRWTQGESVVIHCAAGCGRTSLAAITFLLLAKVPLDEALKQVRSAGSEPDTEKQRQFLQQIASRHGDPPKP